MEIKRVLKDGGFWQAVTGTIKNKEEQVDTLKRELYEEAGLNDLVRMSEMLHSYDWSNDDVIGNDLVYAVEVSVTSKIKLEPKEHDAFKWLPLKEATALLKDDGNKRSMCASSRVYLVKL